MTHPTLLLNRLVHFESFEVYFWKRISKNFFYFSCIGLVLSIIYIPFDYQLHRFNEDFYYILGGRATAVFFAVMVVLASYHPWFEHRNIIAITTFGTMGFSAVTLTYLLFGNPVHFVVYSWFFYLVATMMMTPLITNKIFFIMEGYQVAFIAFVMAYTQQKPEGDKGASFIMLDIDHFKKVNDTYGHECGDLVIQSVSQTLLEQTRDYDIIGRLGGEEVGILLPQTHLKEAQEVAERIRQKVETTRISYNGQEIRVTVSLGLIRNHGAIEDFNTLVVLGDKCLYKAKQTGRNRVVNYDEMKEF